MLTFITPVSPDHQQYLPACIASIKDQTIPCEHLYAIDHERRGPGYIRNRLLEQATTQYIAFLDADDWLEPDYAEKMLVAVRGSPYAYCDWYQDGAVVKAPERAWCNGTFHLVTSVVPRTIAVLVGGFDEDLPALEDTDFYLKLISRELCGKRVAAPLVHYRARGGRSDTIHQSGTIEGIRAELTRRYGGKPLGCCGSDTVVDNTPIGERHEGDMLAMALWGGNRTEHGHATGRRYPRISYPKTTWVDPRDVEAAPHMWKFVTPEELNAEQQFEPSPFPTPRGIEALHAGLVQGGIVEAGAVVAPASLVAAVPNFNKLKRMAGAVDWPIFVAPRKDYPSYADFWKLADLSGFEKSYADEIDLSDGSKIYIFCGPDGIPDCSGAKARTVLWQLEYVGDYTQQPNIETVSEIWSSDPEHARSTDAKYVLLGSHPALNPTMDRAETPEYDLTMLAYLTPRRQAIKEKLDVYRWAPDYPGHEGNFRHDVLRSSRLMIHVHQHDAPAMTPLRYALAAAYRLPVLSERVLDGKPYKKAITWATYDQIVSKTEAALAKGTLDGKGEELYQLLCIQHPFGETVLGALK